ncbi:N-acetylneuraminate synthase family protein [Candidatus Woesebacteria bacterium]|nr:N-acetylneuraminate synthase family protein [Candidatus Woesebacteria bacterium]
MKSKNKIIAEIFTRKKKNPFKPLFIFEMANNHMGDLKHGLRIIKECNKVKEQFDFRFAFKLQYRDIPTFIHPDYADRKDIKYVKRFSETKLLDKEALALRKEMERLGFISICTPFDEVSVDLIVKHNFDVIKIGSCSFGDWPLLECIVKTDKPIIASTAGASLETIDRVVNFFQNRKKQFAIMHCVGKYPTPDEELQLNQIDLLRQRYPDVVIGFSTHEEPSNAIPVQLALAKGASIFERHVAVETKKYAKNAYSSTPSQIKAWLESAQKAIDVGGVIGERAQFTEKEMSDLRQFKRGVFAKYDIKKGQRIESSGVFNAFPNQKDQLVANDLSKYMYMYAKTDIKAKEPIMPNNIQFKNMREDVLAIVLKVNDIIKKGNVIMPQNVDIEISHHYGMEKFYEVGATLVTCINRDYCKKLIVMLPKQLHPIQYHKKKEETFHVLYGNFHVILDGKKKIYKPGDLVTIERGVHHSFVAPKGGIIEEISSTHFKQDSFYEDDTINKNKDRKTYLKHWIE